MCARVGVGIRDAVEEEEGGEGHAAAGARARGAELQKGVVRWTAKRGRGVRVRGKK
jgi:hypothetical protein